MSTKIADWVSFWDRSHSIYVNARHADVHYRDVADAIVGLLPRPDVSVLDFGCGEALHADRVAAVVRSFVLVDAAPSVRRNVVARFAHVTNISVVAPEDLRTRPDGDFDLVVANSVVQYLSRDDLSSWLTEWRRLLAPGGTLIVADVIPPDVGAPSDLVALLRYAAANGFLIAAIAGVARTALSPYRKLRATLGIARYTEGEFGEILSAHGYTAERLARNIEHNPARISFRAVPKRT